MKLLSILAAAWLPIASLAQDVTIIDVRKNLAMADDEKVYRDFYINGGSEAGLAPGMVVTVQRNLPLYDTYQSRSAGDLQLKVAKIKIIHAQKGLAVARMHSEFTRENAPLLEDNFIMVGDRLDLASATTEKEGKKAAEAEAPEAKQEAPVAALKAEPQIVVNSVELSSEATQVPPPTPDPVQAPILQ